MGDLPTYTKTWHNDVYPEIDASRPELSAKGKRVVITGGAGGIGSATAKAFAIAGALDIILVGRTLSTLNNAVKELEAQFRSVSFQAIVADVSSSSSTTKAFEEIKRLGKIDIYVNNAGYLSNLGPIASADAEEWWKGFEINIRGSFIATQAALKNISEDGVIINVTTGAGHVPYVPGHSSYAVSKCGSARLFEYVQNEHPNLRVFNLQPGIIEETGVASKATAQSGISWPQQDTRSCPPTISAYSPLLTSRIVELPGNYMVWLSSPLGAFLKGKFVWANWDVKELAAKVNAPDANPMMLTIGLYSWPY